MKKKLWFYLSIIQSIVLSGFIAVFLWSEYSIPKALEGNIQVYLDQEEGYNILPDVGYIPDAKTAKIIGSKIINNLTGNSRFHINHGVVIYDEENRLWKVAKSYLFRYGGIVVIEQDSGRIVKALLTK